MNTLEVKSGGRPLRTLHVLHRESARMDDLRKLACAVNHFPDAVVIADHDGLIEFVNPAFEAMTGFPHIETVGCSLAILSSGMREIEFSRDVRPMLHAGMQFRGVLANRTRSGGIFHAEWVIGAVRNGEGKVTHVIATGRDMTDHVRTTEGLKRALEHDGMTGLPNRSLFFDRLSQILKHSARCGGVFALGMIDVDRFKAINDRFGHLAGDALLQVVAFRLQHCVRDVDTVARLGGDEFGLILVDAGNRVGIVKVLDKIVAAFATPAPIGERAVRVSVSVGTCIYPGDGEDQRELLERADSAMYAAKAAGGDRHCPFREMDRPSGDRYG